MAEISAALVKELRDLTNLGMMDCKKALTEAAGDKEKALKILKERGLAVAAKRADREATEGVISITGGGAKAYMIKVGCETDFVAKNADFTKLVETIASKYEKEGDALLGSPDFKNLVAEATAKTGEKIVADEAVTFAAANGFVETYLHTNKKVGVLAEFSCAAGLKDKAEVKELGRDIVMQIAAMAPVALSDKDIGEDVKKEQKEIFMKQMADSGKPADVLEKIVMGKLSKHFADLCLLDMPFVKDGKVKIKDLIARVAKQAGGDIQIVRFKRMQIGK